MNVKVLKKTADEIKMEIEGEGHTFCNLLQQMLLEDEAVETANYTIKHPLVSNPVVYVRMKEGRKPARMPQTALREATERIGNCCKEFKVSFEKASKERLKK